MNILMISNTYLPHVGGVAKSVDSFSNGYISQGHNVLIVAPEFKGTADTNLNVVRLPAIQNFNGSDFSVVLPIPSHLSSTLERFEPDIVHSHHPFLLGSTAMRISSQYRIPLVFTHHTMYEHYAPHYVPLHSKRMQCFAMEIATRYANLCHHVIAPSESIEHIIKARGVRKPVSVIPTGVDISAFENAKGLALRDILQIPRKAFVIGHLGRLAPEKNLDFLAHSVLSFLRRYDHTYFLLVGVGPSKEPLTKHFRDAGLSHRLVCIGNIEQPFLAAAYHAMNVFAFCSQSETQGMVLTEAMAAGVPVVALDAPGVREVVVDKKTGACCQTQKSLMISSKV